MTIYEKLYAEAAECMAGSGKAFSICPEAYAREGGKDPFTISVEEGAGLKGEAFLQFFFYRYFNRLPDQRSYGKYCKAAKLLHLDRENVFELFIANHIRCKREIFVRDKRVYGIKEWRQKLKDNGELSGRDCFMLGLDGFITKTKTYLRGYVVYPLWMLLPQKSREKIKRMIGKK